MNNRDVKFRAWDEGNKVMHYDFQFIRTGIDGGEWIVFTSDKQKLSDKPHPFENPFFAQQLKIQEFTGLKDKNNKDIYEGDIVNQEKWVSIGKYAPSTGIVKYKLVGFTCECIRQWQGSNADLNGNATVIGNIYENPELLK